MATATPTLAPPNAAVSQKPMAPIPSEVDVVLVFDASPTPEGWYNQMRRYVDTLLPHFGWGGRVPVKVGVVTYGRAPSRDSVRRTSPILARIPFSDREVLMDRLQEQYNTLAFGIGTASSSGGMAVLEALVAAIDMCVAAAPRPIDKRILARRTNLPANEPRPHKTPPIFQILMFSHSQPNTSARASFNITPELDNLTWDALPDELKRRRISLHIIMMKHSPALALLHKRAAVLPGAATSMAGSGGHTILLTGIALRDQRPTPRPTPASAPTALNARKRPFTNDVSETNDPTTSTPGTSAATPSGTLSSGNTPNSAPSPNKRQKTSHESPRPTTNKPGHLSMPPPPFAPGVAAALNAAQHTQASNEQGAGNASGSGGASTVQSAEEYRAQMKRSHETRVPPATAAISSTANSSSIPSSSSAPNLPAAMAQLAQRGKQNPASTSTSLRPPPQPIAPRGVSGPASLPPQPAPPKPQGSQSPDKPSTGTGGLATPGSNPSQQQQLPTLHNGVPPRNLNAAQILMATGQLQKTVQNQALQHAVAQQAHLRRAAGTSTTGAGGGSGGGTPTPPNATPNAHQNSNAAAMAAMQQQLRAGRMAATQNLIAQQQQQQQQAQVQQSRPGLPPNAAAAGMKPPPGPSNTNISPSRTPATNATPAARASQIPPTRPQQASPPQLTPQQQQSSPPQPQPQLQPGANPAQTQVLQNVLPMYPPPIQTLIASCPPHQHNLVMNIARIILTRLGGDVPPLIWSLLKNQQFLQMVEAQKLSGDAITALLRVQLAKLQQHVVQQQQQQQQQGQLTPSNSTGSNPGGAGLQQQQQQGQGQAQGQLGTSSSSNSMSTDPGARRRWVGAIKFPHSPTAPSARVVATAVSPEHEGAAKIDLWPSELGLGTAGLAPLPATPDEFLRKLNVPVVRFEALKDADPQRNAQNQNMFSAVWSMLFPRRVIAPGAMPIYRLAFIPCSFGGSVINPKRGIALFSGPKIEDGHFLLGAVYVDQDIPAFPEMKSLRQQMAAGANASANAGGQTNASPAIPAAAGAGANAQSGQAQQQQTPSQQQASPPTMTPQQHAQMQAFLAQLPPGALNQLPPGLTSQAAVLQYLARRQQAVQQQQMQMQQQKQQQQQQQQQAQAQGGQQANVMRPPSQGASNGVSSQVQLNQQAIMQQQLRNRLLQQQLAARANPQQQQQLAALAQQQQQQQQQQNQQQMLNSSSGTTNALNALGLMSGVPNLGATGGGLGGAGGGGEGGPPMTLGNLPGFTNAERTAQLLALRQQQAFQQQQRMGGQQGQNQQQQQQNFLGMNGYNGLMGNKQ